NLGSDRILRMATDKSFDVINLDDSAPAEVVQENRYQAMRGAVMEVVSDHFRPELLNRIDEVVVFHPLEQVQIRRIADLQLDSLRRRLHERELGLEVTPEAMDKLVESGYDPAYGA